MGGFRRNYEYSGNQCRGSRETSANAQGGYGGICDMVGGKLQRYLI